MNIEQAVDQLWSSTQRRTGVPAALAGQLATMEEGYRLQLGVLARRIQAGERLAGWKVGLSAAPARRKLGLEAPLFGYLLESARRHSGERVSLAGVTRPALESELCATLGRRLAGPGATRAQAMEAVSAVAPAFEIVERRCDITADFPLGVGDNVIQWGYVTGEDRSYPAGLASGDITAELLKNDVREQQVAGRDSIDDIFESLAALANHLAAFGRSLEGGQRVMTGTYTKPTPIAPGERWEARFTGIGTVSAEFV